MNLTRHIFAQLVLLIAFAAAPVQFAEAQDSAQFWVIVAKSGEVKIVPSGSGTEVPAGIGTLLDEADRLMTAGGGNAVLASDNDLVRLGEDSEIEIARKEKGTGKTIILRKGSIQAKIQRRPDLPEDRFRIETDYLAATVKGTTYTVKIDPDLVSASVGEGTVRASPVIGHQVEDDKGLDVHIGQTAVVHKAEPGVVVLLGAPKPGSEGPSAPPAPGVPPPPGGGHDPNGSPSKSGPSKGGAEGPSGDAHP